MKKLNRGTFILVGSLPLIIYLFVGSSLIDYSVVLYYTILILLLINFIITSYKAHQIKRFSESERLMIGAYLFVIILIIIYGMFM